jgi:uncharacterized membrane protein YdjX (TVP38/TMEM64 family)
VTATKKRIWIAATVLCIAGVPSLLFLDPILSFITDIYDVVADKDKTEAFLMGLDWWAPLAYMAIQTLQVVIAPVPGEVTGFIGGYLFGTVGGFVYSTIALTFGSWINFLIGRYLGKRWIRRLFSPSTLSRMDFLLKHQGAIVVFILFLLPGFPKDGLCFFLGLSALPIKVLVIISGVGRIPGTLILCAQGASLSHGDYLLLAILTGLCVLMAVLAWWFREPVYRWIEKQKHIDM